MDRRFSRDGARLDRGSPSRLGSFWAFAKDSRNKVIASLELLATLIAVKLWVPDSESRQISKLAIRGYTDNQSNEALVKKAMTTKFPSTLVLLELAEELAAESCELYIGLMWIRRDANQLADDRTNENFTEFSPDFRIPLKGEEIKWRILDNISDWITLTDFIRSC